MSVSIQPLQVGNLYAGVIIKSGNSKAFECDFGRLLFFAGLPPEARREEGRFDIVAVNQRGLFGHVIVSPAESLRSPILKGFCNNDNNHMLAANTNLIITHIFDAFIRPAGLHQPEAATESELFQLKHHEHPVAKKIRRFADELHTHYGIGNALGFGKTLESFARIISYAVDGTITSQGRFMAYGAQLCQKIACRDHYGEKGMRLIQFMNQHLDELKSKSLSQLCAAYPELFPQDYANEAAAHLYDVPKEKITSLHDSQKPKIVDVVHRNLGRGGPYGD